MMARVLYPCRNKKGQPLLLYKKNLVGKKESLPLTIINEGTLISKVYIDVVDPDGVFSLAASGPDTRAFMTDAYEKASK